MERERLDSRRKRGERERNDFTRANSNKDHFLDPPLKKQWQLLPFMIQKSN